MGNTLPRGLHTAIST